MSGDKIKIKGENGGLALDFPADLPFPEIMKELGEKLDSGSGFFLRGTLVRVPRDRFTKEEFAEMQELFRTHGLICRLAKQESDTPMATSSAYVKSMRENVRAAGPDTPELRRMVVIDKTLRGGQAVETEGSVIVFGNVNPGAQITAGGSVDIRGTCRGVVHAGASGDATAFIIADHLMPTQIRIANYVARSPDEPEDFGKAERAYVKDGQIVIEPIER